MRETVTIQVGEYANFVGSHFWNFQVPIVSRKAPTTSPFQEISVLLACSQILFFSFWLHYVLGVLNPFIPTWDLSLILYQVVALNIYIGRVVRAIN